MVELAGEVGRQAGGAGRRAALAWLAFAALGALQLGAFLFVYQREIAWHQPEFYDQAVILLNSYRLSVDMASRGLAAVWDYVIDPLHAGGFMLPLDGALAGLVVPDARLGRLAVNFAALLALEAGVLVAVAKATGHRAAGFAGIGMVMGAQFLFQPAGGMFDFRVDFVAACLFGLVLCAMVAGNGLLGRRSTVIAALLAVVLVAHRVVAGISLTATALAWTLLALGAAVAIRHPDWWRRARHGALLTAVGFAACAGYVVWHWSSFAAYYLEGHVLGSEKIARAREQGLTSLIDHLLFYPRNFALEQVGPMALGLVAVLLAVAATRRTWRAGPGPWLLLACLVAVATPLGVLTLDVSKSPVVGGLATVAALLPAAIVAGTAMPGGRTGRLLACLALLAAGTATFVLRAAEPGPFSPNRADLEQTLDLNLRLARLGLARGWTRDMNIAADVMTDRINASAVAATSYERLGTIVSATMSLAGSVDSIDAVETRRLLSVSHVLIRSRRAGAGALPFDASMKDLRSVVDEEAAQHWVEVDRIALRDDELTIYLRPGDVEHWRAAEAAR